MSPHTSPRRRDAEENRLAILGAARSLLRASLDATLDEIAAEAGLTRRAIYGHFATRDELVREVITSGGRRIAGAVDGVEHADPVVKLLLVGARLWAALDDVRAVAAVALLSPFRHDALEAVRPLDDVITATLHDAQRAGTIRTDIPARTLARVIEQTAIGVFTQTARGVPVELAPADDGLRLILLSALGIAGYSWREADELLAAHPEVLATPPEAHA